MAFHNANYKMIPLTGGTYTVNTLGNGITASTVHEVYCISAGTISISAIGGGVIVMPMTAGQSISVLVEQCTVTSGSYIGFAAKFAYGAITPTQWGLNP